MPLSPPSAPMGFIGYVRFQSPEFSANNNTIQVRATSADIRLSQEITKPDVVDGRFDRTVYQLGPKIVEGSVEFPSIMESIDSGTDPTAALYKIAVRRNFPGDGKLSPMDVTVAYASNNAAFIYKECIVNTFRWSVAQSDVVSVATDLIGVERESTLWSAITEQNAYFPNQSRVVTWNDAVVELRSGSTFNITGEFIRSFEATINNNAERYYTLNGKLFPQDVAPRKRDIMGSVTLMGRKPELADHAFDNQERCAEVSTVKFGYNLTNAECQGVFLVTLPNVVFQIEELALSNDLFETTVNWHCLPNNLDLSTSAFLQTS